MARKQLLRQPKPAIVVIVDGDDEKWYISQARSYYPNNAVRSIKIKPELVQHKRCRDLFESAHQRIDDGASSVFLVLDLDTIRKDAKDFNDFHNLYAQYLSVKAGNRSRSNKWMERLIVIVNNPCLEFWYLLHFKPTTKCYNDYIAIRRDIRSINVLSDYDKSQDYYYNTPDIFTRLGGIKGLEKARLNSKGLTFNIATCNQTGISEMASLFNFFDTLQ